MKMIEIRWHGRGGQGGVTSAELLAKAAYYDGFKGVQAFPYFGAERRGAPVKAFTRISDKEINVRSQIYEPDIVAVLDPSIIDLIDVTEGLKENGKIIINIDKSPEELDLNGHVFTYDGTGIALKYGLLVAGLPVVNTTMLGAFAKATDLVKLESGRIYRVDDMSPHSRRVVVQFSSPLPFKPGEQADSEVETEQFMTAAI